MSFYTNFFKFYIHNKSWQISNEIEYKKCNQENN